MVCVYSPKLAARAATGGRSHDRCGVKVVVRLFAQAREAMGVDRLECELRDDTASVRALLRGVQADHGCAVHDLLTAAGVRVAVNQEFVDLDQRLEEGDEVAFLPRVTGG